MVNRNRISILSNATAADLVLDPYPHLVIENALDRDVFEQLEASYPDDEIVVGSRDIKDTWYDYPACHVINDERIAPIWREFFAFHTSELFFKELVSLAGDRLRTIHPLLERRASRSLEDFVVGMRPGGRDNALAPGADVSMECQFYANYTRAPRAVRGPHVDRPSELFAALLYFRQPNDSSTGSDLQICEAIEDVYPDERSIRVTTLPAELNSAAVRVVKTAPYKANTLVLFLNSHKSLHAVSPRTPTPLTRRHINFCCDLPFDLFDIRLSPRLRLKHSLESTPILWRLANLL